MRSFVRMVRQYRFLWLRGRFGGGKTSLSLAMADELVKMRSQRFVVVNFPLLVDVPVTVTRDARDAQSVEDAVLLLDEAGQFLDTGASPKQLKAWFSYLRKANQVVLMASVLPIAKFAASFTVQRIFNGLAMGLPFWLYQWRLSQGDSRDGGRFAWWFPQRVFGVYDTNYRPDDRWYIYDFEQDRGAAVGVGIASESDANVDADCDPSGGDMGGQLFLELARIVGKAGSPQSTGDGDGGRGVGGGG